MANVGTAYLSIMPSMKGFGQKVTSSLSGVNLAPAGEEMGRKLSGGLGKGMDAAGKATGGFSGRLSALAGVAGGVAASLTSSLVGAVSGLAGEMVAAADSSQKFASTLQFAGIDDSTIKSLTQSTQEYADQTVYELADIRNATAQLAANGVEGYAELAEAAGNLNAVAGGNSETFKSVSMVMSQTAGSGKLLTENWNQLTDAIPGASGALQDAMREAGSFEGNFREAMESGEISAEEFFAAVQKLGMTDVAIEAATSTSTIEGAMGNLQASVVGVGSQVISALTPAITGAMGSIAGFVSGIPAALAPVGAAITTALSGGGTEGVATAVRNLIAEGMSALSSAIQQATSQLPTMLQTTLPIVLAAFTAYAQTVWTQFPGILMSFIGLAVTAVSSFVSTLAGQLPTILPILVSAAIEQISNLLNEVFNNLPTYIGQLVQAALDLFQGIVDAIPIIIPIVVSGIGDLVRNVLTNLPSFLGQMLQAAVELFNGIVRAIPEIVPAVLDGIASLLGEVFDAITSFDLLGAGRDLIQGLIDGILSMGSAIIDAIGGVVGGAIDWAKGLLGIASPSKLFRKFGVFTMEGFALGIIDAADAPIRAMSDVMSSVADAAADARIDVPEVAISAVASSVEDAMAAAHAEPLAPASRFYAFDLDKPTKGASALDLLARIVELLEAIYGVIPEGIDERTFGRLARKGVAYAV